MITELVNFPGASFLSCVVYTYSFMCSAVCNYEAIVVSGSSPSVRG